jgi:hypothetical protein
VIGAPLCAATQFALIPLGMFLIAEYPRAIGGGLGSAPIPSLANSDRLLPSCPSAWLGGDRGHLLPSATFRPPLGRIGARQTSGLRSHEGTGTGWDSASSEARSPSVKTLASG